MIHNTRISIIAAIDEKRGLGKNNDLLFRISEDLKRLRELTTGHTLVMGRKTFESLGRLLPNRTHIVITRDPKSLEHLSYQPHFVASSLEEGLEVAKGVSPSSPPSPLKGEGVQREIPSPLGEDASHSFPLPEGEGQGEGAKGEIFVFGGGQIFTEAIEKGLVDRLYLTIVEGDYGADVFFPEYPEFTKVISEEKKEADGYKYKFLTLERE